MTSKNQQLVEAFDGFKILGIPYAKEGRKQYYMYIMLPITKDELRDLIDKISSGFVLDDHIPLQPRQLSEFRILQFSISFNLQDSRALKVSRLKSVLLALANGEKRRFQETQKPKRSALLHRHLEHSTSAQPTFQPASGMPSSTPRIIPHHIP
ncbi:Serpin-ZX-like protein [Drosera capensis]